MENFLFSSSHEVHGCLVTHNRGISCVQPSHSAQIYRLGGDIFGVLLPTLLEISSEWVCRKKFAHFLKQSNGTTSVHELQETTSSQGRDTYMRSHVRTMNIVSDHPVLH